MAKETFKQVKEQLDKARQEAKDIKSYVTKKAYYQGAAAGGIAIAVIYTILLIIF